MVSALIGLQLGAFSVVLQTFFSGKTELPFGTFVLLMQPIHLGIGVVEGLVTSAVVTFIWKARPEILEKATLGQALGSVSIKKIVLVFSISAVMIGGVLSWFASSNPDGLEWAMYKTSGKAELESHNVIHKFFSDIQSKTAVLPDYGFKSNEASEAGTSFSGVVGGILTLVLITTIGIIAKVYKKRNKWNGEQFDKHNL